MAKPKQSKNDLAIVACHFNAAGFTKPVENLHAFIKNKRILEIDNDLFLGVCLFPGQDSVKVDLPASNVFEFRSESILWQKEALLNAVVAKLPAHYTKVAILDADVLVEEGWHEAASKALDEHQVIQPWSRAVVVEDGADKPGGMPSVGKAIARGDLRRATNWANYHPGYAWAMRRDFFTDGPGLYPYGILGLSDGLLALALYFFHAPLKDHKQTESLSPAMMASVSEWHGKLRDWQRSKLSCIDHTIKVLAHGARENRRYYQRLELLRDFDPASDIEPVTGPLEWTESARTEKRSLLKAVAEYFHARLEDGPGPIAEELTPEPDPNWPPPTIDTPAQV